MNCTNEKKTPQSQSAVERMKNPCISFYGGVGHTLAAVLLIQYNPKWYTLSEAVLQTCWQFSQVFCKISWTPVYN